MEIINNLGQPVVAVAKVGLSRDDKIQMRNEVVEIVGDATPKGVAPSNAILSFQSNVGMYVASDTGGWYYWDEIEQHYVYGGLYQESPRLIDLGNNFNEFKSTEENLSLICNKIASRDSGETVASNNYIYHAIVNGNDKVIALYAGNKNSMTFYLSTDSKDTTKYSYFKTYVGTYVEGAWRVERYIGVEGGSGTTDFNALFNKPRINGVELVGNVSTDQLGIKIENAVTYKGSVDTYIDLNSIETKQVGDMYNVNDTGRNYVWNGTGWDDMGEIFDLNKLMGKVYIEQIAENGKIEEQIIYHFIKNKLIGTYLVNDFYLVNCQEAYANHFWVQAGNILGSGYFTYSTPTAPEDLPETPNGLGFYKFSNKEYVDDKVKETLQKIEIEQVSGNGTIEQQIINYFIKNKKVGTYLVNNFYLVNNVLSYTNHYSVQIGDILGSGYVRNYNPIAPEDLPENPKDLEVYRHNIQDYVDTAIQNAITTALNADY